MKIISYILFTLISFIPAYAQIHISGNVSGVLQDTTYIVDGYLRVLADDTLTIEPGSVFLFSGNYQLQTYGRLNCIGTEQDSIYFLPQESIPGWGCLSFDANCDDLSQLSYCYIAGCLLAAINCYSDNITISHCTIAGNFGTWGGGIYLNDSHPVISHCQIYANTALSCGGGIYATHSNPLISDCLLSGNHCDGLGSGMGGGGVCFNHYSNASLTCCIIANNTSGQFGGGISCVDNSNAEIRNCTIYGNFADSSGAGIEIYYANPNILNNIIAGNIGEAAVNFDDSTTITICYNDFYTNENSDFGGNYPPDLGLLINTNVNGDSCDVYHNIYLNPQFYSIMGDSAFHLQAESPCIDAGDPISPPDPDSTIADIGACYYDQTVVSPVINDLTITIEGNDIILQWTPVTNAVSYNIYLSTEAYFNLSGMIPIASVSEPYYIDQNALFANAFFYLATVVTE